jgi:hypothetical protein
MSSGVAFLLGLAVGAYLASMVWVGIWQRRRKLAARAVVTEVSEETRARARALLSQGQLVNAVRAVRAETGWDLRRAKAYVDTLHPGDPS